MSIRVGVIGGGQLARMMIPPAIEMGIDLCVLAESEDSSARHAATMVGDYTDASTVLAFARTVDVITFDHEHVPLHIVREIEQQGTPVRPGSSPLEFAQDKARMRQRLSELNSPVPRWVVAHTAHDVQVFLESSRDRSAVAKTPRGGYDGKGVRVISSSDEVAEWLSSGPILLEEKIGFVREVAQLVARRPNGDSAFWPLVETRQRGGVCSEVIAPAVGSENLQTQAKEIAQTIAHALEVVGVLAVEMFEAEDGSLLVNELAMRPHNSGHIFTELSRTSQFEQHVRAVADLPLGNTDLVWPHGVMVNIFGGVDRDKISRVYSEHPSAKVHDYGKTSRAGRKAGHVSCAGHDLEKCHDDALSAAKDLTAAF